VSPLRVQLADYLAVRRALGYRLDGQEHLLRQFIDYLEAHDEELITIENALAWATLPGATHRWHGTRLSAVRGFARHLRAMDLPVEVPPSDLLPEQRKRAVPYLYSDTDIAALITQAGTLSSSHRVATFRTLIGVLAVTGMRRGEAIAVDRGDFDPMLGVITVWHGKFDKARELPLHPTTVAAVDGYLRRPDRPRCVTSELALFVGDDGRRISPNVVNHTFRTLTRLAGLRLRSAECRPRLHDLRHTFAVRTLLDAYRSGEPTGPWVMALSTYLGHSDPSHTYWYLQAAPELMELASDRLERHLGERA
jgi:integrase